MTWACLAASGMCSWVFTGNLAADRRGRINSEAFGAA